MAVDVDTIHVIATTMSGSVQDQRKVGRIVPEFERHTRRSVRLHTAETHARARALAHEIVLAGGRTLVSAGGAGTLNAVLEGAHLGDTIPDDARIAFLRKGSADLIGKVLGVPDHLEGAVRAIVGGLTSDALLDADVLLVRTVEPDGAECRRHIVSFGGIGVFGDVPRFTESRLIKYYKGLLGTLFGDLGPFLTGMTLAMVYWHVRKLQGRVPAVALEMDGEAFPPEVWGSVMVLNGDLTKDFPLGRGLPLGSGSFRVVALHDHGLRMARRQIAGGRSAALLDDPERYAAVVRTVRTLEARPVAPMPYMVNVDGLKHATSGHVDFSVAGRVHLVRAVAAFSPSEAA